MWYASADLFIRFKGVHLGNKLYVRNLGSAIDSSLLEDLFTTVGDVKSVVVRLESKSGTERLVAHIQMETEQQASDCIDRFHGHESHGQILIVTEDKPHVPDPNFQSSRKKKAAEAKARARG